MTRSRRLARAFPAWYAGALAISLGSVETAKAMREPRAVTAVDPVVVEAVVAIPPKPDPGRRPTRGDGPDVTPERCESMSAAYADACFAALARGRAERDPDGALDACARVADEERRQECEADVAEGHALVDVERSRAICERIQRRKWRDQCVFGIANAWARTDATFALQTCEDAGRWRPFCRHDVNGERATMDPDGAVAYCASLDPAKQPTCWHGIGKYVGRVDVGDGLALCDRAPLVDDARGQCVHGVGWAAAEDDGPAAAARCERLAMRDSCLLGVAYHTKRFDRDAALGLCDRADDAAERSRCREFVERRVE